MSGRSSIVRHGNQSAYKTCFTSDSDAHILNLFVRRSFQGSKELQLFGHCQTKKFFIYIFERFYVHCLFHPGKRLTTETARCTEGTLPELLSHGLSPFEYHGRIQERYQKTASISHTELTWMVDTVSSMKPQPSQAVGHYSHRRRLSRSIVTQKSSDLILVQAQIQVLQLQQKHSVCRCSSNVR